MHSQETPGSSGERRPRASDLGIHIGSFPSGPIDAITDVEGVRVGHRTVVAGDSIRTGITAILPHERNLFLEPVHAAIVVGNGFGKLTGSTQVGELGVIETPILLTGTLNVWKVADGLVDTLLMTPGNEDVRSINPVVGETNDGWLNDIRQRPLGPEDVRAALRSANDGPVDEGSVGAGTGTTALGFKGGIGTSSRQLPAEYGGYTVGVLVQSNFGGSLVVDGIPVGQILAEGAVPEPTDARGGGSIMIVIATDAPIDTRNLERLAFRSFGGLARTGASFSHGSGDYAIAFTTDRGPAASLDGDTLTALFMAVQQATEQAILNSLFRATTVVGVSGHTAEAVPIDSVQDILRSRR